MLTEVISRMDRAVFEIALVDAFCDLCFYEGDEFIADLDAYLDSVDVKTNTKEQDNAFIEFAMPYIENSIMLYSSTITEGLKTGGPGDPANSKGEGLVGGEVTKVIGEKQRGEFLNKAGLKTPTNATKKLTEAEEIQIWEGVGQDLIKAAKEGSKKAKIILSKTGKNLADSVTSGIVSAKNFAKNLSFKIPEKKSANPAESK